MDESVKYYIQQARRSGYNDLEIKQALLAAGWNQEFVDLLLGQAIGDDSHEEQAIQRENSLKEWLKSYFKASLPQISIVTGLTVGSILLALFEPWALKFLVDSVFESVPAPGFLRQYTGTITLLTIVAFLILISYVGEHGLRLLAGQLSRRYSFEFDRNIKTQFFAHIIRLPIKYRSKISSNEYFFDQASAASSDVTKLVLEIPVSLLSSIFGVLAAFIIMFTINIPLAITSLLILPALFGVTKLFTPPLEKSDEELESHHSAIKKYVAESVDNMMIVQSFNKEKTQSNKLLDLLDTRFHSLVHDLNVKQGFEFVRGLIVMIGLFTIVYVGGRQIFVDNMTVGELLIFVFYINQFYGPLEVLTKGAADLRGTINQVQKFYELLVERTDVDTQEKRGLQLTGLNQGIVFKDADIAIDETPILNKTNFVVKAGERVGIIGAAGAGKTTLLNVLPLFSDYASGSISIDGLELKEINTKSLRDQMTVISQEPNLFSDTILNNILYAVDRTGKTIESQDIVDAVTAAGALEFIESLPNNYDTDLAVASQFLTPVQRLRIALARAFLRDTPILLIDEPTESLDVKEEKEVMETVFKLMKGRTVILASNKMSLLTQMTHVYVIDNGNLRSVEDYGGLDRYASYLAAHELI